MTNFILSINECLYIYITFEVLQPSKLQQILLLTQAYFILLLLNYK